VWFLAALSAIGIALAVLAFLVYGAMLGGRAFFHHLATYNGAGEEQKPDEQG